MADQCKTCLAPALWHAWKILSLNVGVAPRASHHRRSRSLNSSNSLADRRFPQGSLSLCFSRGIGNKEADVEWMDMLGSHHKRTPPVTHKHTWPLCNTMRCPRQSNKSQLSPDVIIFRLEFGNLYRESLVLFTTLYYTWKHTINNIQGSVITLSSRCVYNTYGYGFVECQLQKTANHVQTETKQYHGYRWNQVNRSLKRTICALVKVFLCYNNP